jgi:DeoR family deoxyribose operon repressor
MTRPSRQRERIAQVIALLDVTPALHLRDLADQVGVAEMTLRRDAARAESGFSCRGGYVVRDRSTEHYDFDTQMSRAIDAKRRACEHALDQVEAGAVVFLDTGTTLPHLARLLAQSGAGRIVTHCFTTADILQGRSQVPVEFMGGEIKSETRSCHTADPVGRLAPLAIDVAFLSAGGIDFDGQLSCSHQYELSLKKSLISLSRRSFVVIDEGKLGACKPVPFGQVEDLSGVVTEQGVHSAAALRKRLTPAAQS